MRRTRPVDTDAIDWEARYSQFVARLPVRFLVGQTLHMRAPTWVWNMQTDTVETAAWRILSDVDGFVRLREVNTGAERRVAMQVLREEMTRGFWRLHCAE